ncbi:MAG: PEP-CTERM sorting domain-containing protein [Verrucomicrobia bacterium]|nr:PEP-CTERM sorting domain-containing protein [Verrucomicrobiota bacterium]
MKILGMAFSILLLFFQCSYAAITMYTDRNAWRSAAGGSQVFSVNFNSYGTDVAATGPLDTGPFTLTPNGSWYMPLIDSAQSGFGNTSVDGTAGVTMQALIGASLLVSFDNAVGSFGFDLADSFGGGRMARITTSTGDFHDFVAHTGTVGFIGLVSTGPITSVTFSSISNVRPLIDNFEANSASAVPEPSAVSLLGFGIVGLLALRRMRKEV